MAMVMDSNGYWTWENPARRKDARALSKALRNSRAPFAAIGQRLLGPLGAAWPSELDTNKESFIPSNSMGPWPLTPSQMLQEEGGYSSPLGSAPPGRLGDTYQQNVLDTPTRQKIDADMGVINANLMSEYPSIADRSLAQRYEKGAVDWGQRKGRLNPATGIFEDAGKRASWEGTFPLDIATAAGIGFYPLFNAMRPEVSPDNSDLSAPEIDERLGYERLADTVLGWLPSARATTSTGGGLTAPPIADDRVARGLGGAEGFGEGLALANDAWSKGLTSAWDDGLYGADEVVLDMDIPENVMLAAGTRAQQGQPGVPLHMQKAMDTTLASDMLSGYDLGQYESKAGKLFSDRPATKDEPFDSYVRTTSGMGLLPGVEVQDTWSFQPSVFKSHDINPIVNLAEHVTQPIRATSSWVDQWSPRDYRDMISMVTTPTQELALQEKGAMESMLADVQAANLGSYEQAAIDAIQAQAIADPYGDAAKFSGKIIGDAQKAQEAERVAQAAQVAAQAEAARAAQRASVTQQQAEQAVVTRNQLDRGLQQAEAQRVADIITRASTVPVDRGLKKAEENRKAQQAAQAAALNQQAAQAAAAHQAQAAKAQAELAAFKNSREYQDFNASIPAHLIDMATQVDTFSDIAYGGHQGRHGEGWGGESTASRGGRGGAF